MKDSLFFLLSYFRLYKWSYLAGIVFIILTNWIMVTIPEYLKLSIDLLSKGTEDIRTEQATLFRYLVIMLLLAGSIVFIRSLSRIFFFNPGRAIEYRIKNDLFNKLTLLQKPYYDQNLSGSIISKIQNDINGIRLICGFGLMQIFNILTALSLTPYKMYQLSPHLTFLVVIPVILVFVVLRTGMHFVVKHTELRMISLQRLSAYIVSALSGLDVIKGSQMQSWADKKFKKSNDELLEHSIRISFFRSFLFPVLNNMENILKVLILFIGGIYVIEQKFTIGELTAFISYAALLSMPIMGLGWLTTIFETGFVGIASLQTIFNQPETESHLPLLPEKERKKLFFRGIEVRNLMFSYPGQSTPVLQNISFDIKPDQIVGILGKVGSGKTTLINCLNKYLVVERGMIHLNGHDIQDIAYADLRSVVRTVSQDAFLFSDSIKNNILFGANEEEEIAGRKLEEVIVDSALKPEIDRFPQGIDTVVGERGIMLSGGQKQRISLARAMMAPFDLLILDNILSAVDYETERYLLQRIYQKKTAKSLLIVSHRVQALEKADRILVLDKGNIVDQGTHAELINRPGLYRETWELQAQSADE